MSHTKGELKTGNTTDHNIMLVCGKNGKYVCSVRVKQTGGGAIAEAMESERIANAEHLALCWNSHDDLLAACKDLINANVYARQVSLRDEAPRGSVWGEARSCLDAAKLNAQTIIRKIEARVLTD